MAEYTFNGVKHKLKEGGIPLHVKVGGHILDIWYQDKFSRKKIG
jgi:hypothetical protein